jgi:hypothetical protein
LSDRFAITKGRLRREISHLHEHPSRVGPEDFPEQLGNFADDGGTPSRLGLQLRPHLDDLGERNEKMASEPGYAEDHEARHQVVRAEPLGQAEKLCG